MTTVLNSNKRLGNPTVFQIKVKNKLEVHCACLNLGRVHLKPEVGLISKR